MPGSAVNIKATAVQGSTPGGLCGESPSPSSPHPSQASQQGRDEALWSRNRNWAQRPVWKAARACRAKVPMSSPQQQRGRCPRCGGGGRERPLTPGLQHTGSSSLMPTLNLGPGEFTFLGVFAAGHRWKDDLAKKRAWCRKKNLR